MDAASRRGRMCWIASVCCCTAENCWAKPSTVSPNSPTWEMGASRKRALSTSFISAKLSQVGFYRGAIRLSANARPPACMAARREPFSLPEHGLNTMADAKAPSARHVYALKWSIFSAWCEDRDLEPVTSKVSVVLSFLQEMLDKQRSSFTIKVYVAAIVAFHAPIAGCSWAEIVR